VNITNAIYENLNNEVKIDDNKFYQENLNDFYVGNMIYAEIEHNKVYLDKNNKVYLDTKNEFYPTEEKL
jgi:hypothetical protein